MWPICPGLPGDPVAPAGPANPELPTGPRRPVYPQDLYLVHIGASPPAAAAAAVAAFLFTAGFTNKYSIH